MPSLFWIARALPPLSFTITFPPMNVKRPFRFLKASLLASALVGGFILTAFAQEPPEGERLKDIAGSQTLMGTIIGAGNYLPADDTTPWKEAYRTTMRREFSAGSIATGAFAMWSAPYQYDFSSLDEAADLLTADNKFALAFLTAWGYHQHPDWLKEGTFSEDELINMMEQYIKGAIQSNGNRDKIDAWSVVNEAIFVTGPYIYRASKFSNIGGEPDQSGLTGEDRVLETHPKYIRLAFEFARKYAGPDAKLELRDNNCEFSGRKHDKPLYQLAKHLKNVGAPVDVISFQTHLNTDTNYDWEDFKNQIKKYRDLGYGVYISELDIGNDGTEAGRQKQREVAYNVVRAAREAGASLVNCWGTRDGEMGNYREGEFALYFESRGEGTDFFPKPSYYGVQQALLDTQDASPEPPQSDTSQVIVAAQGTTGEEQIVLTIDGTPVGEPVTLSTTVSEYRWSVDGTANSFSVEFVNDGNAADGTDKNVRIDYAIVGADTLQAENQPTNTGSYTPEGGCGSGGASEWLYCQGYITFDMVSSASAVPTAEAPRLPNQSLELQLYPNPGADLVRVGLPKNMSLGAPIHLQVLTTGGQVVHTSWVQQQTVTLPVDNLSSGTYLVKVVSGGQEATQRLLVE